MRINRRLAIRMVLLVSLVITLTIVSTRHQADTGTCGVQSITVPFTDVMGNLFFCQIAEAYFSGLTNGTSATTYSPGDPVPREQMAAFITRTQDSALRRGSKRAALNQWWTPQTLSPGMLTALGNVPVSDVVSDGIDLWTIIQLSVSLERWRASDGTFLAAFNAPATTGVVASDRIYLAGAGTLSYIEKGSVTTVSSNFAPNLTCMTYDGRHVWTGTDSGVIGKTSVVDNSTLTIFGSFGSLNGMLFDGSNVWVTETRSLPVLGHIHRLDEGAITLSVTTGIDPRRPIFDGTNIWVPNNASNTVTVIRAATGAVLANLSGNGLNGPTAAAFDGQRILVTNTSGNSVSLWRAADLSPLGSVSLHLGSQDLSPAGVCSDGVNFWVVANSTDGFSSRLIRF